MIPTSGSDVVEALAREMGLLKIGPNRAVGEYRDFPILVRCFASSAEVPEFLKFEPFHSIETTLVLMFQVSYPPAPALQLGSIEWPEELATQVNSGRARISHEHGLTWFTRFGVEHDAHATDSVRMLNQLLDTLHAAGIRADRHVCHMCMRRQAVSLNYSEHGIEQICNNCREARVQRHDRANIATFDATVALVARAPLATLATALIWATPWIGIVWISDRLVGPYRKFHLPLPLFLGTIAFLAEAWLLSGPQTWLIGRIEGRGLRGARVAALSCLLGIVLGELAFLTFMTTIHRVHVESALDLQFAWRVWYAGGVHTILRLCLVGFAVVFAFTSAKPNS